MVDGLAFEDVDLFGGELDDPVVELEQDLWHRLIEPPGSNLDDPNRGVGIAGMLSGQFDPRLAGLIEADFRKDERVEAVLVDVTVLEPIGTYRLDIAVQPDAALVPGAREINLIAVRTANGLIQRG